MARPNPLDLTVCPTPDVMAFPLTIVTKLRYKLPGLKTHLDRQPVPDMWMSQRLYSRGGTNCLVSVLKRLKKEDFLYKRV